MIEETRSAERVNKERYESPEAVEHYARATGLQPAEQVFFSRYILPSDSVLDLGIGAGRTTEALLSGRDVYVGIDYSAGMIEATRKKFPSADLRVMDASDLSAFSSASFDVVIFSFNGLDTLMPLEKRATCLRECARVLKPGGRFIYSSHNPRRVFHVPAFSGIGPLRAVRRILYSVAKSAQLSFTQPLRASFWRGRGYYLDSIHGGIVNYSQVPEAARMELAAAGLDLVESLGGSSFPRAPGAIQPWIYYVARRPGKAGP